MQVASTTPALISSATRVLQQSATKGFQEPGADARLCLETRHGICGNHVAVALALFREAGFQARPIEFYYEEQGARLNHIIAEVNIGGAWRAIDATFGAFWIDKSAGIPFALAETDRILNDRSKLKLIWSHALVPYHFYSQITNLDPFGYLRAGADIVRGGAGDITVELRGDIGQERFKSKPNYVGDNVPNVKQEGVSLRLKSADTQEYNLRVKALASAVSSGGKAELCVDDHCLPVSPGPATYEFQSSHPKRLYVRTSVDIAYVVMEALEWHAVR